MNAPHPGSFLPHRHTAPVRSRRRSAGCFAVSSRISVLATALLLAAAGSVLAVPAVTFTVDTTQDTEPVAPVVGAKDAAGHTSLRAALMAANVSPGTAPVTINFNIPGGGAPQIGLGSLLPEIVHPIALNAATQPGLLAGQRVGLAPQAGVSLEYGLFIVGGRSVVAGLNIEGFEEGILIQVLGSNAVQGCRFANNGIGVCIGTYRGNDPSGGSFANLIGGLTPERKNIFVSNTLCGILTFWSQSNVIAGNSLGIDEGGAAAGNKWGIILTNSNKEVVGGKVPGSGNLIANNERDGIAIAGGQKNLIYRNTIAGNQRWGIVLCSGLTGPGTFRHAIANQIGGSSVDNTGNVISRNRSGVLITCDAAVKGLNKVQGNYIGTDDTGGAADPNIGAGVMIIGSSSNLIGGAKPGLENIISGNLGVGVVISTLAYPLEQLLHADPLATLTLPTLLNIVQGNIIGANPALNIPLGNGNDGVLIDGASGSIIGGTTATTGNFIANNVGVGVHIQNSDPKAILNQVIGNNIKDNVQDGVFIDDEVNQNVIGGKTKGMGNEITGNGRGAVAPDYFFGVALGDNANNGVVGNSIVSNGDGTRAAGIRSPSPIIVQLELVKRTAGKTLVKWTISDAVNPPKSTYRVEFFANLLAAESQGQTYLGGATAHLDENHTATGFSSLAKLPNDDFPDHITATATLLNKSVPVVTSAFSNVVENPPAALP